MFTNPMINYELAKARQHDLLVQAERHNRAREARRSAPKPPPAQAAPRRSRRAWRLVLRPLFQS